MTPVAEVRRLQLRASVVVRAARDSRHPVGVTAEQEIHEIVDRETRAWNTQDVDLLLSIFHPDMVWTWPPNPDQHDPEGWVWGMGRFDAARWRAAWTELFREYALIHNGRDTVRVSISDDRGGAFAVVDVDTLWRHRTDGTDFHWQGRACKVYTRVAGGWKLIMHTGLLHY